jgi:hypothetical protein
MSKAREENRRMDEGEKRLDGALDTGTQKPPLV